LCSGKRRKACVWLPACAGGRPLALTNAGTGDALIEVTVLTRPGGGTRFSTFWRRAGAAIALTPLLPCDIQVDQPSCGSPER